MTTLLDINWNNTWIIVGLGMGLVLTILTLLVFVMLAWEKINRLLTGKNAAPAPKTVQQQPAPAPAQPVETSAQEVSADLAAIATTLYLLAGGVHDVETAILTINAEGRKNSEWNNKVLNINTLNR